MRSWLRGQMPTAVPGTRPHAGSGPGHLAPSAAQDLDGDPGGIPGGAVRRRRTARTAVAAPGIRSPRTPSSRCETHRWLWQMLRAPHGQSAPGQTALLPARNLSI